MATTFPGVAGRAPYTPRNFEGGFSGRVFTLRQALARSMNSITAWLVLKLTPETVVAYAKRLGITSPIDAVPAIGFGSSDCNIYELCGAYGTFVWTAPPQPKEVQSRAQASGEAGFAALAPTSLPSSVTGRLHSAHCPAPPPALRAF